MTFGGAVGRELQVGTIGWSSDNTEQILRTSMTRRASLRIETSVGNQMEPISIHVCAADRRVAIVSLEDFDTACEALQRIRHNHLVQEDAESSVAEESSQTCLRNGQATILPVWTGPPRGARSACRGTHEIRKLQSDFNSGLEGAMRKSHLLVSGLVGLSPMRSGLPQSRRLAGGSDRRGRRTPCASRGRSRSARSVPLDQLPPETY
jgi:hypothetical protein